MPRLVLIIDEFAAMVAELPDFVHGLIDIARRGRSLGVHLLLATQRPAGVVSADIRANTNLRIALRVTSTDESADVIDAPDSAYIAKSTPGISSSGKRRPQSTAMMSSPDSISIMLRPISPRPRRRAAVVAKLISLVSWIASTWRPSAAATVPSLQPSITRSGDIKRFTTSAMVALRCT